MSSEREALFNSSDLGDLKGGAAPFFNTLLALLQLAPRLPALPYHPAANTD